MAITYREITNKEELFECVKLQQKIFGLTDLQTIPMLILNSLGNNPTRSGLIVGAYDLEKKKLIGFTINLCTSKPNTMFGLAAGLHPEYQNSRVGLCMFEKMFQVANDVGFDYMDFYFNPLKYNLGRLYINYFRFKGIRFMYNAFPEFEDSHRIFGIAQTKSLSMQEPHIDLDIHSVPILTKIPTKPDSNTYLLKIPKKGDDPTFFFELLDLLINHEGYIMENCITLKQNNKREYFYVIQKEYLRH